MPEGDDAQQRFDIDIVDRDGRPCVRIEELAVRRVPDAISIDGMVAFVPQWSAPASDSASAARLLSPEYPELQPGSFPATTGLIPAFSFQSTKVVLTN